MPAGSERDARAGKDPSWRDDLAPIGRVYSVANLKSLITDLCLPGCGRMELSVSALAAWDEYAICRDGFPVIPQFQEDGRVMLSRQLRKFPNGPGPCRAPPGSLRQGAATVGGVPC
jgi:hypothetical protein